MSTAAPAAGTVPAPRPAATPESSPRERLRVAPNNTARRIRARLLMLGVTVLTIASLFALVGFRVVAAQSAFTLDRLSKERTNEQLRYERLRAEVAQRSSPGAIISSASSRGMVFADRKEFIQAPAAARDAKTPTATPKSLAPTSWDEAKRALDQNP
jgi:hypothetical protein